LQILAILKFLEHVVAPLENSSHRGSYQLEGADDGESVVGYKVGILVIGDVVGLADGADVL